MMIYIIIIAICGMMVAKGAYDSSIGRDHDEKRISNYVKCLLGRPYIVERGYFFTEEEAIEWGQQFPDADLIHWIAYDRWIVYGWSRNRDED